MQFISGVFSWGLNSWIPSYWMNVKGLSLTTMGFAAAIPNVVSALFMFFTGYVLDRCLNGKEKWLMAGCAGFAAIFTYLTFIAPTVTLGVIYMTIATITASAMTQTSLICVIKYFPQHTIGAGAGIANGSCQLAGIFTPAILGYIITLTNGNYTAVFGTVIFTLFIGVLIALSIETPKQAIQ